MATPFRPPSHDLIGVGSRRWFLQSGLTGFAGVTLSGLSAMPAESAPPANRSTDKKSVIVLWLSGGMSHIDTWDPKPDAAAEIRGPFATIATRVAGMRICEHLPLQANIANKFSLIRSVECKTSEHYNFPMQAGNPLARFDHGNGYPSMGSIAAKFRGPNHADFPAFIAINPSWKNVAEAGRMGGSYRPVNGLELLGRLGLPNGISINRLQDRDRLRRGFDHLDRVLDRNGAFEQFDQSTRRAFEMLLSGQARNAFDLSAEPDRVRDAYGRDSLGEKVLLARRLVEAGVTFVHLCPGEFSEFAFDSHGNGSQFRGIVTGLQPLLPQVDRAVYALVNDLDQRGLLDDTLVLALGEFGRTPVMNRDAGRDHWTNVMSMLVAGGGLRHGQVVGSTDSRGYDVKSGLVRPQDIAATVFRHLGIDLGAQWISPDGRPISIVVDGGRPIPELG